MKISKVIFHIKPIPSHPWWECNKFIRLWRYKIKIQLYNVCILCDVWLKVANNILRLSNVQYPNWGTSVVEYSIFDGRSIESKKSDIRRRALRMSNIRHSTDGRSNRKNPTSEKRLIMGNLKEIHSKFFDENQFGQILFSAATSLRFSWFGRDAYRLCMSHTWKYKIHGNW